MTRIRSRRRVESKEEKEEGLEVRKADQFRRRRERELYACYDHRVEIEFTVS